VATGILAWQLLLEGKTPRGNLKLHMFLALVFQCPDLAGFVGCISGNRANRATVSPALRLAVEFVAVAVTLFDRARRRIRQRSERSGVGRRCCRLRSSADRTIPGEKLERGD